MDYDRRNQRNIERVERRKLKHQILADYLDGHFDRNIDRIQSLLNGELNNRQEEIVAAALEQLHAKGLDGLSLREIAKLLRMQAPGLYWHFKNKEVLVDFMAEAILQKQFKDMKLRQDQEKWQDWLTIQMKKLRKAMLAYPDGGRVVAGAHLNPTVTLAKIFECALESLASASVDSQTALRIITTVTYYTFGYVIEEQASPNLDEMEESFGSKSLEELYPNMASAIKESNQMGITKDDNFLAGLQYIIAGAAA
jgi:TetR/AcrR family tetracycline transcriptional repressor